ncbi:MAG: hypothetical protein IPP88_02475 [Betaproteobacteria bacterium]|nr:hypothetical protein [Betaproteobacteria bacterium]
MFKKTIPIAVAVGLSLSAGAAVADQTFHTANDEAGAIMHYVPGTKSRTQVEAERTKAAKNDVTADGWRYVGGETGWELVQHAVDFHNGKWAHADKFDHNTPKPSLASLERARKQYQDLYSGG